MLQLWRPLQSISIALGIVNAYVSGRIFLELSMNNVAFSTLYIPARTTQGYLRLMFPDHSGMLRIST